MKSYLSKALALVLVVCISFFGSFYTSALAVSEVSLTGNYTEDTVAILQNLSEVINLPSDTDIQVKKENQAIARKEINDYISRYRKNSKYNGLKSFTTMQTALNSLAGYYTTFGSRPMPEQLQKRLTQEFRQVEFALKKGY